MPSDALYITKFLANSLNTESLWTFAGTFQHISHVLPKLVSGGNKHVLCDFTWKGLLDDVFIS